MRERETNLHSLKERERKKQHSETEKEADREIKKECVCVLERERVIQKREGMRKVEMRDRDTQGEWSNIQQERES